MENSSNFSEEYFTEQEIKLLQPFTTNIKLPIFGLRNLPEVVKGALFSRYSRSNKSLRRILLDEFINSSEASFAEIVGKIDKNNAGQLVAIEQAEAFYDRVLVGYGDDSVAELGGAHIACEGISNIAAKAIEDSRLGISPLEKSTRYVPFNQKINGQYRYYPEPSIMASSYAGIYSETLDHLFDTYSALFEPLFTWVKTINPKDSATTERAYFSATKAKTFDLLRGLLPMATLTNVGLFGNGRAFEYLLIKLAASPHAEVQQIGLAMQTELDKMIPSFVKRAKTERGAEYVKYLSVNREKTRQLTENVLGYIQPTNTANVELIDYDRDGESKVIAAILYPHTNLTLAQVREYVDDLSIEERIGIINTYIGERKSRFHRPNRAFEETYYTFDILADIGAYRDLQRHRVLTQQHQKYTVDHGYIIPNAIEEAKLTQQYQKALDNAAKTTELISKDFPDAAQYVVPFAYKVRWQIKLNLREAYHFIELRSARQGHPTYRAIAQSMYYKIKAVHPLLIDKMTFVDTDDYALERLASEQKIDVKREEQFLSL